MSTLRKLIVKQNISIVLIISTVVLCLIDSYRMPDDSITVKIYVACVRLYQTISHNSIISSYVRCRYNPTCSQYSIEAVERHGIKKGFLLSLKRIWSCRSSVPMGTFDPVPN